MSETMKNQKRILEKLKIAELNPMQQEAHFAIHSKPEVILLSPTGSGKTLAFLLPIIAGLDKNNEEVQALILVPSRELAIQIEQVSREMGAGFKINAVYGGRPFSKDKLELQHRPAVLIGTPGRVADHLRRDSITTDDIKVLVLDEFDKSLEIGFEDEMSEITRALSFLTKKILTSATQEIEIPNFVGLKNPTVIDYLAAGVEQLQIKSILSPSRDKLETLVALLRHLGNQPGIVFCNFKDSIQRTSDFLTQHKIDHGCFHGSMEQKDRERALIKFRNGTNHLILATDLAARGIDIPEIKFIIHYHLPVRSQEFTHRNGRTARMNNDGTAYVLHWEEEALPDFIKDKEHESIRVDDLEMIPIPSTMDWATLFISGGRKDKISKGDIAGLFFKQGKLEKGELGIIELKQDCAFVAVPKEKVGYLIQLLDNTKLKKRKLRVKMI